MRPEVLVLLVVPVDPSGLAAPAARLHLFHLEALEALAHPEGLVVPEGLEVPEVLRARPDMMECKPQAPRYK